MESHSKKDQGIGNLMRSASWVAIIAAMLVAGCGPSFKGVGPSSTTESSTFDNTTNGNTGGQPPASSGNQPPPGIPSSTPPPTIPGSGPVVPPNSGPALIGALAGVTTVGQMSGTAYFSTTPTQSLTIEFYLDGNNTTGTFIGSTVANLTGNNNQGINDRFVFQLPATYANGVPHDVYAYAVVNAQRMLLPRAPARFAAYTPKAAGMNYFNNTIRPSLNACLSCHGVQYDIQYSHLSNPSPFLGGTATANSLIDRASGINHPGGNFCGGGKNSGICATFQTWWNMEFGN